MKITPWSVIRVLGGQPCQVSFRISRGKPSIQPQKGAQSPTRCAMRACQRQPCRGFPGRGGQFFTQTQVGTVGRRTRFMYVPTAGLAGAMVLAPMANHTTHNALQQPPPRTRRPTERRAQARFSRNGATGQLQGPRRIAQARFQPPG